MLTEVEEDIETWAATNDEKEVGQTDPYNTAVNAINRISIDLGEKAIMAASSALIKACIQSGDWKQRQAGYMVMGLIAEACRESMTKNMNEAMQLACSGIVD
jgi:hypothetical protein